MFKILVREMKVETAKPIRFSYRKYILFLVQEIYASRLTADIY